jgi:WD40 repeat protein
VRTAGASLGRYVLRERLGTGGTGEVWRAFDSRLSREVALKFIAARAADPDEASWLERLRAEARALARLDHPGIVTLHELEESGGTPFLVLELVCGVTLRERLAEGRLSVEQAVVAVAAIAEALAAAHQQGVVHGDLHPGNVVLPHSGGIKILDFGLSRLLGEGGTAGAAGGTIGYLPPERLRDAPVDERGDLFALGAILYHALAGRRPFERPSGAEELIALTREDPTPLRDVDDLPLALVALVSSLLAKEPAARPSSALEVASQLRHIERRLATASPDRLASPAIGRPTAFRGLLPFSESDRDAFFGRETEIASLLARVCQPDFRLGVLYGESGSGKTSLLRAGLVPGLRDAGFLPLLCRSLEPLAALAAEGRRQTGIGRAEGEPIDRYLRRLEDEMAAPLVVIFDQFEEFFVAFPTPTEREPLVALLAASAGATPAARFLLAIRSDFLHLVAAALDGRVDEPLAAKRRAHLAAFDPAQARDILERSARAAALPLTPDLVNRVAEDLATAGRVLPSELQIVGEQLQRRTIVTIAAYDAGGGREQLVHRHLEEVVEGTRDADGARRLLLALVSEEGTRRPLTLDELAAAVPRSRGAVVGLLEAFVGARLVREIQDEVPWRYELQHEYLIGPIERSGGEVLGRRERANRLLRQHASAHALDRRALVPLGDLLRIRRDADPERRRSERDLLRRSWRRGLLRASATACLVAAAAIAAAAALAVREEWRGERLAAGHTAAARACSFSPDGRQLATGGEDGRVILWDFPRRQAIATFGDYGDSVTTLAVSPDGRWLAYGGRGGRIVIRDLATRRVAATIGAREGVVAGIQFSPDGRWLAASDQHDTSVWEIDGWAIRHRWPVPASFHATNLFTADSRLLYAGSLLNAWETDTGRPVVSPVTLTSYGCNWAALSPDGREIIGVGALGEVRFVDLGARAVVSLDLAHRDHGRAAAFSPDGTLAATGAEDVALWDVRSRRLIARLEYPSVVWSIAFSPDGGTLVSTHGDGSVVLWDVAGRERTGSLNEHSAPVRAVAFSPDGQRLATAGDDRSVILWSPQAGTKLEVILGQETRINGLAFAPDGGTLAACDQNGGVSLWDLVSHERLWTYVKRSEVCYGVTFSHDGRWVASTGQVLTREGRAVASLPQRTAAGGAKYGLVFGPGDQWLAVVTDSGEIARLGVPDFALIESVRVEGAIPLVTVDVSPDGSLLVAGGDDGVVRLFQAEPLRALGEIGRHPARLKAVAFSRDGRRVASASDDRTVALWDVKRRTRLATIGVHSSPILALAFSPDGNTLAVGAHDSSVRLYGRSHWLWGRQLDGSRNP